MVNDADTPLTPFNPHDVDPGEGDGVGDVRPDGRYAWPPIPCIPSIGSEDSPFSNPKHAIHRANPRNARLRLSIKWRSREFRMQSELYAIDASLHDIARTWGGLREEERYVIELVQLSDEIGFGVKRVWTSKVWGASDLPASEFPIRKWMVHSGGGGTLPEDVAEHLKDRASLAGRYVDEHGNPFDPDEVDPRDPRGPQRGRDDFNPEEFDQRDPRDEFDPRDPRGGRDDFDPRGGRGAPNFAPPSVFHGGHQGAPQGGPFHGAAPAPNFGPPGFPAGASPFPGGFPVGAGAPPPPPPRPVDLFGGATRANGHVLQGGQWVLEALYLAALPRAHGQVYVAGQWIPEPPPPPPPVAPPVAPPPPPPPVAPATDPMTAMLKMMEMQARADKEAANARQTQLDNDRKEEARLRTEAETKRREDERTAREAEWRREDKRRLEEKEAREAEWRREDKLEQKRREDAQAEETRRKEEARLKREDDDRRRSEELAAQERIAKLIAGVGEERKPKAPAPEVVKMLEVLEQMKTTVNAVKEGPGKGGFGALKAAMKELKDGADALGVPFNIGGGGGKDDKDEAGDWERAVDRVEPVIKQLSHMVEMYFAKDLRESDATAAKATADAKRAEADLAKVQAELAAHKLEIARQQTEAVRLEHERQQILQQQHFQQQTELARNAAGAPAWGPPPAQFAAQPQYAPGAAVPHYGPPAPAQPAFQPYAPVAQPPLPFTAPPAPPAAPPPPAEEVGADEFFV